MTLGFFAPLPPSRSGVADYAAAMLRALEAQTAVRVNSPGDLNLYHIGNNRLHADIYRRCLAEPGVVILHDPMLHHLLLGCLDEQAYVEDFVYNYGEWSRAQARQLWQRRGSAMADPVFFRFLMLRRLIERSRIVIVHTESARQTLLRMAAKFGTTTPVFALPHLAIDQPQVTHWEDASMAFAREHLRRENLGVQANEFLAGVFGYLRESKRLHAVLRAVHALRAEGIPLRLLVAGDFASEDYERAINSPLQGRHWVIRRKHCDLDAFRQLLQAVDLCVNLRYPSAGESSGIAARALALGTPILVSEGSGDAGLPEGCVVPVATGPAEGKSLAEALRWLACDRAARRHLAMRGQQWCREHMDPEAVCRRLLAVVTEALSVAPGEGAQSPPC